MVAKTRRYHLAADPAERVIEAFVNRGALSAATRESYLSNLRQIARFLTPGDTPATGGDRQVTAAVARILDMERGEAKAMASQYMAAMMDEGLSPGTINLRIGTLCRVVTTAKDLGVIGWTIDIKYPRVRAYRDTRGPTWAEGMRIIDAAVGQTWPTKAARDVAAGWMLLGMGLRSGELRALTMADVDLGGKRLAVIAKGAAGARQWLTMPPKTLDAVANWISLRGTGDGPLIAPLHPAANGSPMSKDGLLKLIGKLAATAGLRHTTVHMLRHTACTEGTRQCRGNLVAAQSFTRHADPNTVIRYNDGQVDRYAEVAAAMGGDEPIGLS